MSARERVRGETRQLQTRVRQARLLIERYREEIKRLDTANGGGGSAVGGGAANAVPATGASASASASFTGAAAESAPRWNA